MLHPTTDVKIGKWSFSPPFEPDLFEHNCLYGSDAIK